MLLLLLSLFLLWGCSGGGGDGTCVVGDPESADGNSMEIPRGFSQVVSGDLCDANEDRGLNSEDLKRAPPNFTYYDESIVFVDIEQITVNLTLDVAHQTAIAEANISFMQPNCGLPVIDLIPDPTSLAIGNATLDANSLQIITDPDGQSEFRVLAHRLPAGRHSIQLRYEITDDDVIRFNENTLEFFSYMDDRETRPYAEHFFPANFIFDQYAMTARISITNTQSPHQLFTNGTISNTAANYFAIQFPGHGNSAWPYIHIVDQGNLQQLHGHFEGIAGTTPVTVYAQNEDDLQVTMDLILASMKTLESHFGAYPHRQLIVGLNNHVNMGYPGATLANMESLDHEIAHMWFGRGYFPANGNAEWLDEALVTWYESGYQSADSLSHYKITHQLAGFSPYRRHMPGDAAYIEGAQIIEMLDGHFAASGGIKPILRDILQEKMGDYLSTEAFITYLNQYSDIALDDFFNGSLYDGQ